MGCVRSDLRAYRTTAVQWATVDTPAYGGSRPSTVQRSTAKALTEQDGRSRERTWEANAPTPQPLVASVLPALAQRSPGLVASAQRRLRQLPVARRLLQHRGELHHRRCAHAPPPTG
jgi:hypothetical protein